jgi:hypothetical protein
LFLKQFSAVCNGLEQVSDGLNCSKRSEQVADDQSCGPMDRCAVLLPVESRPVENRRPTARSPDNDFAIAAQLIRGGTDRTALAAVVREVLLLSLS